jgi:hypothetical protein
MFENDVLWTNNGDGTHFSYRCGSFQWKGGNVPEDGDTDWSDTQFSIYHLDHTRSTNAYYTLQGAFYIKSNDGYPISIGNDTGTIQLGNNDGSVKYLEASSTATSLFLNGALKLKTVSNGIEVTGRTYYNNSFTSSDLDVTLATSWPSMYVVASDTNKPYVSFNNQWNELLLSSSSIDGLADVDTSTVAPSTGQVLKWDGAKWSPANDLTGGGGGGLALTDLSASSATASGGGAFAYNNGTGVFTYTPPDLSNYDTAFGWGNHASAGYITSIGDAIQDADFTTSGLMKRTGAGTYTSTTDNSSNWDTAFGWGNHASQGYLTSLPAHGIGNHSDVTVTSPQDNQLLKYNTSLAQWENWTANYLTSESDTLASVTGRGASTSTDVTFSGDCSFAGGNVTMTASGTPDSLNVSGTSRFEIASMESGLLDGEISHTGDVTTKIKFETSIIKLDTAGTTRLNINNSGATITGALTAGGLTYPTTNGTSGDVLTSDGAGNVTWQAGGSGNTQVSISDTIPAGTASAGDLWWESDTGRLKIYYQDTDSSQWVDVNAPLRQDRIASTGAPASASSTGVAGDIRYDSGYVYIAVATNTWKRAALTTW